MSGKLIKVDFVRKVRIESRVERLLKEINEYLYNHAANKGAKIEESEQDPGSHKGKDNDDF